VDELEGMSKKAILRTIKFFVVRMLIHLIKNQVEQRLTNFLAASVRDSLLEIQDLNLKENRTSYYIKSDEWQRVHPVFAFFIWVGAQGRKAPTGLTLLSLGCSQWQPLLDSVLEAAIRTASVEVQGGAYTPFQLSEMVDRTQVIEKAQSLLALTYDHSAEILPAIIDENLAQLPGGEDWKEGRQ
jgi:hypothetical protein